MHKKAYRMSVVASACALNFGLDFALREKGLVSEKRLLKLDEAIRIVEKQVRKHNSKMLSARSLDECKKVRKLRNAFAHPEKYLEVKPSSHRPHYYTLKPAFTTVKEKKEAFIASQLNVKRRLKKLAEESFDITVNSIKEALENLLLP